MRSLSPANRWLSLANLANERRLTDLVSALSEYDCPSILIKGWAIARFYSKGHFRTYTDIDILFSQDRFPELTLCIEAFKGSIPIDRHFGPRKLDKLSFDDLFSRSYEVELNGVPIRVLSDEDNLRITAVHWLTDGGVNQEKLWDIYYLVKNRRQDFDWERCLGSNGPIRKTWVMAAIATARDHLDLDVSGLPREVQEFQLPEWYQKTLEKEWRLGIYPRRILSTVITRPALLAEQLRRKLPPNPIAATIDTESPIDSSSRIPAQAKSLLKKIAPFARGLGRRIIYSIRGSQQ